MADIGTAIQNVGAFAVAGGILLAAGNKLINLFWGSRKLHKECVEHHELIKRHIADQNKKDTDRYRIITGVQSKMASFDEKLGEIDTKSNAMAIEVGKIATGQIYLEKTVNKIAEKLNCV